jgi:hypothetical protein
VTQYDKERVYDEQIAPLLDQVIAICKREGIPLAASFEYRRDADGESYYCSCVIAPDRADPDGLVVALGNLIHSGRVP